MSGALVHFLVAIVDSEENSSQSRSQPNCRCALHYAVFSRSNLVVGSSGLEPPTSRLSGVCSNQLSYEPISSARGRRLFAASVTLLCHAKLSLHTVTRTFRFLIQKTLCAACLPIQSAGGDERNRTDDPLLAKQVLSQLSYTPIFN